MDIKNKKKIKFGWQEILLCAALAFVVVIFIIVFTGNTATVSFVSVGGNFDSTEGATIYDYDHYIAGSTEASMQKYHAVLEKTFRISSIAILPEVERDGYDFEGWYECQVDANGNLTYTQTKFNADSVKSLEKDSRTVVYAKWVVEEEASDAKIGDNIKAALEITWKGMLGIFIVIGIVYLCIVLLNRFTRSKKKASTETDTVEGTQDK